MMNYPTLQEIRIERLVTEKSPAGVNYNLDVSSLDLAEIAMYTKRKGVKSDGHFHKGESKSRDPEHMYVIRGKIKILFEDLHGGKKEETLSAGQVLITPAWVYHSYEVLEDLVLIEPREISIKDIRDVHYYEEFLNFMQ